MITVTTKNKTSTYKNWQWHLAWFLVFLFGILTGLLIA